MGMKLLALRTGRALTLCWFLVLISVEGRVNARAIVPLEVLGEPEISSDLTKNRTPNLPDCSILPQ
jgi:hypothetical protein